MLINSQSNQAEFDSELLRDICEFPHSKVIQALQQHTILHQVADSRGSTLLHFATADGNHEVMKHLMKMGADVNAQDGDGTTPLMLTLQKSCYWTVEMLLGAGASIYLPDGGGRSALEMALNDDSVSPAILRLLIKRAKRQLTSVDDVGQILSSVSCLLYHEVQWKDSRATESRLEAGCSIESSNPTDGRTALHIAVRLSDFENCEMLLRRGADVNAEDSKYRTPLSHFNASDDSEENLRVLRLLLYRGANLYRCDLDGKMQIYYVLKYGNQNVVKVLFQWGIRLMKKDDNGHTPVHYLAENRNEDVIMELRGKKFNANVRDNFGCMPLHSAACFGCSKNIEFLLNNGAKINKANRNCMTPLFFAVMTSTWMDFEMEMRKECIELLLQRRANILYEGNEILTVFDIILSFKNYSLSKPIILHLAIKEARGVPIVKLILDKIQSDNYFKRHLELYRKQLTKMQSTKVYESVTLFKLVADSDRQIIRYAKNRNVVRRLKRMSNKCTASTQCKEYLRKRVSKAIRMVEGKRQAAIALGSIVNLGGGCYTDVTDRIADYLNDRDVKNLLSVRESMN